MAPAKVDVPPTAEQEADMTAIASVIDMLAEAESTETERKAVAEGHNAIKELRSAIGTGAVSDGAWAQIAQMRSYVEAFDFGAALKVQSALAASEWETLKGFLRPIKHFLATAQRKIAETR